MGFLSETTITHAVKNVSFSINRGEILALVGESGSGKSVTALSILQLLPPPARFTNGNILFSEDGNSNTDLLKLSEENMIRTRGNKIAMIFQEPMTSLNPVFTCGYQVREAILLHKNLSSPIAKNETIDWFRKVKLPDPENIYHRYPHQLSGGQKQRVMIAMALCCDPSLLICDEPTTALDVTVQKTILDLIKEIQREKKFGVLFITHDLGVVAELADRALVMYKGEIVEEGKVRDLFTNPNHPYTRGLLACRPILHQKGQRLPVIADFLDHSSKQIENTVLPSQTYRPVQNISEPANIPVNPISNKLLISVQQLSVLFPSKKTLFGKPISFIKAVDDVSFEVRKGETLGLVGESGSGKTTLGRALLQLITPSNGKIIYNNLDITNLPAAELKHLRQQIQIIFQDPYSSLNPRITIGEALAEPLKVHGLYKTESKRKERVIELLEKVNLEAHYLNRYPHQFSGGQRQRIVIARALALSPSFIVCDESVSALDVSIQAQVLNLLNDIRKEFDLTLFFISHDLSVIRYISDRVMVMHNGKIIETGDAEQIYRHPQHEYTKNLINAVPGGFR